MLFKDNYAYIVEMDLSLRVNYVGTKSSSDTQHIHQYWEQFEFFENKTEPNEKIQKPIRTETKPSRISFGMRMNFLSFLIKNIKRYGHILWQDLWSVFEGSFLNFLVARLPFLLMCLDFIQAFLWFKNFDIFSLILFVK